MTPPPRGYGAEHRRARAVLLAGDPVCERCRSAPATHGHHKRYRRAGGPDVVSNLAGLCASCHAETHGHAWKGWAARD